MSEFFHMGGHAAFIWPSYIVTFVGLGGLILLTLARQKRARTDLDRVETMRAEKRAPSSPVSGGEIS